MSKIEGLRDIEQSPLVRDRTLLVGKFRITAAPSSYLNNSEPKDHKTRIGERNLVETTIREEAVAWDVTLPKLNDFENLAIIETFFITGTPKDRRSLVDIEKKMEDRGWLPNEQAK